MDHRPARVLGQQHPTTPARLLQRTPPARDRLRPVSADHRPWCWTRLLDWVGQRRVSTSVACRHGFLGLVWPRLLKCWRLTCTGTCGGVWTYQVPQGVREEPPVQVRQHHQPRPRHARRHHAELHGARHGLQRLAGQTASKTLVPCRTRRHAHSSSSHLHEETCPLLPSD